MQQEEFARRLRAARAYGGLGQDEMAERLGIGAMTYKRSELGSRSMKDMEQRTMAEAMAEQTGFPLVLMLGDWDDLGAPPEDSLASLARDLRRLLAAEESDLAVYDGNGVVALIRVKAYAPLPGQPSGVHHGEAWEDAIAAALRSGFPDGLRVLRDA